MMEIRDGVTGQLIRRVETGQLQGCELSNVCLADLDFQGWKATEIDCNYSTLRRVKFGGAELSRARFANSRLESVDFSQAKLTEVDFTMSNIEETSFAGADLGASFLRYARCIRCDFTGASLRKVDLSMAVITGSLVNVDLSQADLRGADLRETRLVGARFDGARLANAMFIGSNPSEQHIHLARLAYQQNRVKQPEPPTSKQNRSWWQFWSQRR